MKTIKIKSIPWLIQMQKNTWKDRSLPDIEYGTFTDYNEFIDNTMFISFSVEGTTDVGLLVLHPKTTQFYLLPKEILEKHFFFGSKSSKLKIDPKEWNEMTAELQEKQGKVEYNFVF